MTMDAHSNSRAGGGPGTTPKRYGPTILRAVTAVACLAFVCLAIATLTATPRRTEVTTGSLGTGCSYTLDRSGRLTIYPTDGRSGEMVRICDIWPRDSAYWDDVRSVAVEGHVMAPADSSGLFEDLRAMESLDLSGLDTSQVTDMKFMFSGCSSLTALDLSGLDTSKVTDMKFMFFGCSALSSLDLSGLDTSKVTDMGAMFVSCSSLSSLDLSRLDTSQVTEEVEIGRASCRERV